MKLFVSYARVDKPLCKQIVQHLEDIHEVWYDRRLHAGQDWWNEIQERLDWCEGVVYLLSPESVNSEYCQKEYAIALETGKHIFPVLIQAQTTIPDSLSHIQFANLSDGMEDMITLMNALTIAERRQREAKPSPKHVIKQPQQPQNITPTQALAQAADALEAQHFDNAVFIIKAALEQQPIGRIARMLTNMLTEAEELLEKQAYLREASREYAQIRELVQREATRTLGCEEFIEFQNDFPDYDPDKLAAICKQITFSSPPPIFTRILPAPFEWIHIPSGQVTLVNDWDNDEDVHLKRGESRTYTIPAFAIAKYPITNAQFRQFVDADGYKQQKWWTDAGWEAKKRGLLVEWDSKSTSWKTKETGVPWIQPRLWSDKIEYGDDYPVVGVSWYEAIAFCQWLSATSGEKIMLPTELQWQRAAQALPDGSDSHYVYPWGNEWDGNKCNNSVSPFHSNTTTPVVQYAKQGDSPCGVVDMVGNVWEWCLTEYYSGTDDPKGTDVRVLRGGSWDDDITINFYTTVRDADYPGGWDGNVGFRIAIL